MVDFKKGDEVWFFCTDSGKYVWDEESTIIYPDIFDLQCGQIVDIISEKDKVFVYVDECQFLLKFGYVFFDDYVFSSKAAALEAMMKRIQVLTN